MRLQDDHRGKSGVRYTYQMFKGLNEVVHTKDTANVSGVIAKEDTSKGSEGTHQVGPDGDRGLDAHGIDAPHGSSDCTAGHFGKIVKDTSCQVISEEYEID